MDHDSRDPLTRFLATVCAALVLVVALQIVFPAGHSTNGAPDLDNVDVFELPVYAPAGLAAYSDVLERPVVFESRRLPVQEALVEDEPDPREPLRLLLAGVAGAGDTRIAILRDSRGNELIQMTEGMLHRGWTLHRVEPTRAVFLHGDLREELELESGNVRNRLARR